jgi:hypothetical protein
MIHKIEDGLQVCILDPLEVEEGVLVGVAAQNVAEEGGAGGQDHLVGLQLLLIITAQSYVEKILILAQLTKCHTAFGRKNMSILKKITGDRSR